MVSLKCAPSAGCTLFVCVWWRGKGRGLRERAKRSASKFGGRRRAQINKCDLIQRHYGKEADAGTNKNASR